MQLNHRCTCAAAGAVQAPAVLHHLFKAAPCSSAAARRHGIVPQPTTRQQRAAAVVVQAGFGFGKAAEKKMSKQKACPCGSEKEYKECCQPYHNGTLPDTPEQLMRSRYSAYVKGLWKYVVDTTHPQNPLLTDEAAQAGKPTLKDDVIATCDKLGFEKLKILSTEDGANDQEGYVTFQAWFKNKNQLGQRAQGFHTQTFVERSRFLRDVGDRWLYVDGEQEWKR